ncbi:hypothetical protein CRUP_011321 [Coryphaenoides rupestris]|nr:hypothetical protein CRUP_011321 [Coryphaenoides rupestris]
MGEWDLIGELFKNLQSQSPMLGRFWLFLMLVFRILILGTVATDLFEDEQGEFACNTLQPGCKQVCYDDAFPISMYRFWVFHIVLISTPALLYLLYAMHRFSKKKAERDPGSASSSASSGQSSGGREDREERHLRRVYLVNVAFRLVAEVGVLLGQWRLYGFRVEAQFPCSRFPCPYTVDCFTSRPAEKTIFLGFYFSVGVVAAVSSLLELVYATVKWFCPRPSRRPYTPEHLGHLRRREEEENLKPGGGKGLKGGPVRSSGARKTSNIGHKSYKPPRGYKPPSSRQFVVLNFWLFLMLVFRILILGTVATDLFEDEQGELACNTLQPGCKQVCYDDAFPISMYRFWVFHIVLISTPALLYLLYAMHRFSKKKAERDPGSASSSSSQTSRKEDRKEEDREEDDHEERHVRRLYLANVAFRLAQFPCRRFPCPHTVDCFTSRPAEKTIFLGFYFSVSSLLELVYATVKWFCPRPSRRPYTPEHLGHLRRREEEENLKPGGGKGLKGGPVRSSGARKTSNIGHKSYKPPRGYKPPSSRQFAV